MVELAYSASFHVMATKRSRRRNRFRFDCGDLSMLTHSARHGASATTSRNMMPATKKHFLGTFLRSRIVALYLRGIYYPMKGLRILIGGATGFVGSQLVTHLSENYPSIEVRALTRNRNSEKAISLDSLNGVTVIEGDYGDRESLEAAASGVDRAYVACSNSANQNELECNFIDACQSQGASRIIKISTLRFLCRENGPGHGRLHYQIEQHLSGVGIGHAIVHPSYYFQSLLYFAEPIKAGVLPQLLGEMKLNMVDCRDIAQFSAALLTCSDEEFARFDGSHIEIEGPENLGGDDWVNHLRQVGVDVQYARILPEQFKEGLIAGGVPEDVATNITDVHRCFHEGSADISSIFPMSGLIDLPGAPTRLRRFASFVKEVAPILKKL
ncbi:NAD(P)H-binding protein [Streptomyces sp. NPDC096153]|uniref:SDR family oxidoreductase n=1 Tax=Streptomyces sp. NPDC096153 TaxID=3155548 RepID=UPI0033244D68